MRVGADTFDPPLTVVDVGARGGLDETWLPLLPHLRAYAFEPDPAEYARLASEHGSPHLQFVPLALGAAPGQADLYVTKDPACSSLYRPDEDAAARYRALEVIEPTGRRQIEIDTLDHWADRERIGPVSFLKLDTQGSELDILRGATTVLRDLCALRVEVEFNPIYVGQPLFGEVDGFLREHGFVLWRLANLCHYTLDGRDESRPYADQEVFAATPRNVFVAPFVGGAGRLFWGEAYFVRRELAAGDRPTDPEAAARADCVLTTLGFHDLATVCR